MSPTFHTTPAPWLSSVQCFWSHVTHPCDIRHMWGDAQLNQLQGWKTFCSYKIRLQLTFTPHSRTMAAGRNLIQRLKNMERIDQNVSALLFTERSQRRRGSCVYRKLWLKNWLINSDEGLRVISEDTHAHHDTLRCVRNLSALRSDARTRSFLFCVDEKTQNVSTVNRRKESYRKQSAFIT